MSKTLIAYFSACGNTKALAERLAKAKEADLFEIAPVAPYTPEDLDFTNPASRCSAENGDPACRPAMLNPVPALDGYDTILLGFPIWWGHEPAIVDSFLDSACLKGKTLIPFCTSGMSPVFGALPRIRAILGDDTCVEIGGRLIPEVKDEDLAIWPQQPPVRADEEELVRAFHMMWDNYPEQVRLIDRKFRILAGNKAYMASGGLVNVGCNLGNPEMHKGCQAIACLKAGETKTKKAVVNDVTWESFWVPVSGSEDYYVHFTNGLNEAIAKSAQQ